MCRGESVPTPYPAFIMFERNQNFSSITSPSATNHIVDSLMRNQQNNDQLGLQVLSQISAGIVPVFSNPEDEKEWRKGFEKHCTKPSENGRYPEDCFF